MLSVKIQEWIHRMEVGGGSLIIRGLVLVLLFLGLAVAWNLVEFQNLSHPQAMEQAQLGRNVANGEGYVTRMVRPLDFHLLRSQSTSKSPVDLTAHPDLENPPLYPLLVAALLSVAPVNYDLLNLDRSSYFLTVSADLTLVLMNQALLLVAALLLLWIATRLFDGTVGWIAALLFLGTELFWQHASQTFPTVLGIMFFIGLFWALWSLTSSDEDRPTVKAVLGWSAVAGIFLGLGSLTLYPFAALVIPSAIFLLCVVRKGRGVGVMALVLAFLAILGPWMLRNLALSGSPFGSAIFGLFAQTPAFPGHSLERDFAPSLQAVTSMDLLRKASDGIHRILVGDLWNQLGNWVTAFFLLGLLVPFRNSRLNQTRWFLVGSGIILVIAQSLSVEPIDPQGAMAHPRQYFVVMVPLLLLFGCAFLLSLFEQIPFSSRITKSAALVLGGFFLCAPLLFRLLPPSVHPVVYPPYHPPRIQEMGRWMKAEELVMSDMPWAVGWYANRTTLWSTLTPKAFIEFNDFQKEIKLLYLTQLTVEEINSRDWLLASQKEPPTWGAFVAAALVKLEVPDSFPLTHSHVRYLQSGQLLLSDRERWDSTLGEATDPAIPLPGEAR